MYEATTAANEILRANRSKGRITTPLQLIKLLYIAHGFSLAILGRSLFSEPVQAWKYGPVVRSVYHKAKQYGRGAITADLPMFFSVGARVLDADTKNLIDAVAEQWGGLSGTALSNWTHLPGSPWHQVYQENVSDLVIPNEVIQSYFQAFVEKNKQDARSAQPA